VTRAHGQRPVGDPTRLRGLWALHVTKNLTEDLTLKAITDTSEYIRGWSIQLALEENKVSPALLETIEKLAKSDDSQVVRRYLASAAQRLPLELRWKILDNLLSHAEDAGDMNLPLLYWYAAEPLGGADPVRALELAAKSKIPQVLAFMVRRIGMSGSNEALALLVEGLSKAEDTSAQLTILRGINDALKGQRNLPMPKAWPAAFAKLNATTDADIRTQATALSVIFGDKGALGEMRRLVVSPKADLVQRQSALASLLAAKDKELPPVLHKLVADADLRGAALRGLAVYDDPRTPGVILDVFPKLTTAEKRDALGTMAARLAYATELLDAVAAKKVAPGDLSAETVRQLRNLGSKDLEKRIADVWGTVRDTPADRAKLIVKYRKAIAMSPPADLALGRAVYVKTCAQCHTLFGTGGNVGPDITGANRQNLDYLLENIFDPSALIPKEYAATLIELKDGRLLTGIVKNDAGEIGLRPDARLVLANKNGALNDDMRNGEIGKSAAFIGLSEIDHDIDLAGLELIEKVPKGANANRIFETRFQSDFAPESDGKSVGITIALSNGEGRIILFAADNERTMWRRILCEEMAGKQKEGEDGTQPFSNETLALK